jgi:hypothetical protein
MASSVLSSLSFSLIAYSAQELLQYLHDVALHIIATNKLSSSPNIRFA